MSSTGYIPTAKKNSVRELMVTFFVCPAVCIEDVNDSLLNEDLTNITGVPGIDYGQCTTICTNEICAEEQYAFFAPVSIESNKESRACDYLRSFLYRFVTLTYLRW